MTLVDLDAEVDRDPQEPEVLFREARRRRHRWWLISGIVLMTAAIVAATISVTGPSTAPKAVPARTPTSVPPQSVGLPTGAIQALKSAGPLAVNATGSLFVVDAVRHEVLVRLTNGQLRVVAGDGTSGFARDGGPATKAELSDVTDLTFGPNGDLYLADGGRVRVIDPGGVIKTIVSSGSTSGVVTTGAAGSSSSGSQIESVAVSPTGVIYAGTPDRIYRLTPTNEPLPITAMGETFNSAGTGQVLAPINTFGQISVDSQGNIYASSLHTGWSVYKITPDGVATYLGAARGSGGALADVQYGPGDAAYAANGATVVRAQGGRLVPVHTFDLDRGQCCFYLRYFAFSSAGALYADNIDGSAFTKYQEIVLFRKGKTTALWRHRVKN